MISNRMSQSHNMTPNDLSHEQDVLLLAGSKMSYRDIYTRELDLPSYKGKYYSIKDVDNLFVLFNGILTNVSTQAFRNNKALSEARENSEEAIAAKVQAEKSARDLYTKLQKMNEIVESLKMQIAESQNQEPVADISKLENVTKQLSDKSAAYTRLLQSSSEKMSNQQAQLKQLIDENAELKEQLTVSTTQLQELTELATDMSGNLQTLQNKMSKTVSKSDYELLQYKYDKLKKLSIQTLTSNKI